MTDLRQINKLERQLYQDLLCTAQRTICNKEARPHNKLHPVMSLWTHRDNESYRHQTSTRALNDKKKKRDHETGGDTEAVFTNQGWRHVAESVATTNLQIDQS